MEPRAAGHSRVSAPPLYRPSAEQHLPQPSRADTPLRSEPKSKAPQSGVRTPNSFRPKQAKIPQIQFPENGVLAVMKHQSAVFHMTVVHAFCWIVAVIRSGSAKLFTAVIAREATKDDLPSPACLAAYSGDIDRAR